MLNSTKTVICGAGIAGISTAYHLAVKQGIKDIVLVDERPPLSLTSDKSTECYRNWWSGPDDAMVSLMNHSIDLMEAYASQSKNVFRLNRRGYLYVTSNSEAIPEFVDAAKKPSRLGAGPLRIHRGLADDPEYVPAPSEGFPLAPSGADLFLEPKLIEKHFPYLTKTAAAVLHVRRAGWFSAQQLGMYLLESARAQGVEVIRARVTNVNISGEQVESVQLSNGDNIPIRSFVNAAGPFTKEVGKMLGIDLPIFTELHLKVAFHDAIGAVTREAPLLIWSDSQKLPWSDEEIAFLGEDESTRWLLNEMPPGAHTRPEGGVDSDIMLLLWEYQSKNMAPIIPPPLDTMYPEIALRGMAAMLPRFQSYFERMPQPMLDGGYYTKTRENRPLIGPL
ncbi:MAG: FAD-dependent oxidoreductase, partial [Chloroflexota bacterium]